MELNLSRRAHFGKSAQVMIAVFLSFLMVFGGAQNLYAKDSPVNRMQSSLAQNLTLRALKAIENDDWDEARDNIAQSKDPLASKIYLWMMLKHAQQDNLTNRQFIQLSHFIRQNPEWPSIAKLKVRAEGTMPEAMPNQEVLAWYNDFAPKTPYGMGRFISALIIEGKKDQARTFLADWWANTLTSVEQQRKIFSEYGGYLTLDAHKRRFDALLLNKHYRSARAMAAVLGQGYPALADARIALAQNKGHGLGALIDKVPEHLQNDPGLLYERLKWRRKRDLDKGAVEILLIPIDRRDVLNPKEWWVERHIIIRRLLETGDYKTAYTIATSHFQKEGFAFAQAQWLTGWLALRFMNKPTEAYERFFSMYEYVQTPVSRARGAYWAGRAAKDMRQNKLAQSWFKKAAQFQTTFYGQLAMAELSMKDQLPSTKLPHLSKQDRAAYAKSELMQAYALFHMIGMKDIARQFLNAFLSSDETPKAYRFAAEMIAEQGNYHDAVRIAKKATRKGLFLTKQSYPTITKQLQGIDSAEWALIHSLIRQESMFDYDAKSHAGALGLMQLMPATARGVAKKEGMPYRKAWLTEKPKYNMTLGASYIGEMIERYNGSYPLAIAAYNAGPGRVDRWLRNHGDPRTGEVSLIDWIELIPIYETRNYVQRVLEGVYVYRLRLDRIQTQPKQAIHVVTRTK